MKVANASSTSYRRGISADPANKQRDDDCQGVIRVAPFLSSQCLFLCHPSAYFFVIPVPISLSSQCLFLCHPSSPDTGIQLLFF
ncbi:MAG: hypothetical protein ACR5K5_00125 [Wolbachia sp.]